MSYSVSAVSDYVTIEQAANEAIADLIQQRLEEAGIPCRMVPSGMAAVAGAGTAFAVTVPADRADEATELLGG
jgi:putative signal transducing protein